MKRVGVIFILLTAWASLALAADKVETIQVLVHIECKKKVSYEAALALIRPLYLTCVPGTKVNVEKNCELKCLKANSGVVIGR